MISSKPFIETRYNDMMLMRAPNIPFTHAFTTRYGGVSKGALYSLNLGENRGDAPSNVRENYRRLLEALDIPEQELCFTKQVHGNNVRIVSDADRRELFSPFLYEADGIVTDAQSLPLICFSADCVPVLLADEVARVVAAVHCGWRSTAADIIGKAVDKMVSLGSEPKNINAAIGPAIDICCFETGSEVAQAIAKLLGDECEGVFFETREGKFMVDLKEALRRRLTQRGLRDANISVSDECTSCNSDRYWSHRKTRGERGSQAAIIMIN
jgi:YfiH family protein